MGAYIWSVSNGFSSIFYFNRIALVQSTYRRLVIHQFCSYHSYHVVLAFLSEMVRIRKTKNNHILTLYEIYNLQVDYVRGRIACVRHCIDRISYRINVHSHAQFFISIIDGHHVCADYTLDNATSSICIKVIVIIITVLSDHFYLTAIFNSTVFCILQIIPQLSVLRVDRVASVSRVDNYRNEQHVF